MKWGVVPWTVMLFCLSGNAQENKPTFLFTNDFTYQRNALATGPNQFYNSSSLFVKWANWATGLTLRGHNFYKQSSDWTLPKAQYDVFRKYAQYATDSFEIQAGDFHSVLGRGLVLSVLQNEKAFRDRTVLGGDFHYHARGWDFRTLGGSVEDELEQQKWQVAGGEAVRDYYKGNRIGVHASFIHDSNTFQQLGDRLAWSVSWSADKFPGGFSYYAEISRLNFRDPFLMDGSGYYANLGWTRNNVSLLFEYKKYKNFSNELNNPPSADRGDEASDLNDSETFRLYSQYSFFNPDIIPFVSIGRVQEAGVVGPQVYAGLNATELWGKLDGSFSYGLKDVFYPVKITEGHILYRLTDAVAVDLSSRDKRYTQRYYQFNETDYFSQVSWAPHGAVFFQKQYSRQPIDGRNHFHSGGFRINLKRDSYFEFSTGAMRGGEVCSSGQCIFLPPFRGWKVGLFTMFR
ncbi:MAG: DUF6029 family protein [Acidobacteriia bacterium]|nr:DUF6029 family protein [Terriglobia bacterium]